MLDFRTSAPPAVRLLRSRKPRHVVYDETSTPAKAQRKLDAHTFGSFFSSVIVQNSGVIAALPRTILDEDAIVHRVVGLDSKRNVGSSLWWSQRLSNARYDSSYKHCDHYVYSTDGLEKNEWFPQHFDVDPDVSEGGFDYLTLGGFSVTIRALSQKEARESAVLCHRFSHEFEAAASAIAPAVLAGFLVSEQAVIGQAFVTQRHLFRLSDLLREYNRLNNNELTRPGVAAHNASLYELTGAIARKVRLTANARLLKMNMSANTVVFCPHLVEDDNGEMSSMGYGFGTCEPKGVPYLFDFDPVHTRRGPSCTFNADSAYAVMMVQFLGAVRAQFGSVYQILLNKVIGNSPSGAALPEGELPERFEQIDLRRAAKAAQSETQSMMDLLKSMPMYNKTRELTDAYIEAAQDVPTALALAANPANAGAQRGLFQALAAHHLQSTSPNTSFTAGTPAAIGAVGERMRAVRIARQRARGLKAGENGLSG